MPLNFFLVLVSVGLTIPFIIGAVEWQILIGTGLFYIFMIVECAWSKTNNFLSNLTLGENIFTEINNNRTTAPVVNFHV